MARETGLLSNQEFPASVSGVTGSFASRAAGVGRGGEEETGNRACTLTPSPLYTRACFFMGGREGPRRRLLYLKGRRRKDIGVGRCSWCLQITVLPGSLSIPSLPIFSEIKDYVLSRASVRMGNLCLIANLGSLGEGARIPTAAR